MREIQSFNNLIGIISNKDAHPKIWLFDSEESYQIYSIRSHPSNEDESGLYHFDHDHGEKKSICNTTIFKGWKYSSVILLMTNKLVQVFKFTRMSVLKEVLMNSNLN